MTSHASTTDSRKRLQHDGVCSAVAIGRGCAAAELQLRRKYELHYRQHHRNGPPDGNRDDIADQIACVHLRLELPVTLERNLPGIRLIEWMDPHTAVVDSTWTLPGWTIDVYWDYHPAWTAGDHTAFTIWHQQEEPASSQGVARP